MNNKLLGKDKYIDFKPTCYRWTQVCIFLFESRMPKESKNSIRKAEQSLGSKDILFPQNDIVTPVLEFAGSHCGHGSRCPLKSNPKT